jgi:DNA-binding Xre family transcriptional regulator
MKHRLGRSGKLWRIRSQSLAGICIWRSRELIAAKDQRGRELLDTLVHELLHAELPGLKHGKVRRVAESITRMIWKMRKHRRWRQRLGLKRR